MNEATQVCALLPMRASSTRCVNKVLRPFGGSSLARLAVEKLAKSQEFDRIYLAAYEDELLELAAAAPRITPIRRSRSSAFGEDAPTIYDFLDQVREPIITIVNACCPFTRIETIDCAARLFRSSAHKSLLPVVRTQEWYFDESGRPLNIKDPALISSKLLPPVFKASHPFTICRRDRFVTDWQIWTLTPNDPYLFEIPQGESIDIDTEDDFELAEALYHRRFSRAL